MMKILNEKSLNKSRDEITSKSYDVCKKANFPVDIDDVYNHLFGNSNSTTRFLVNDNNEIVGFGVAEEYNLKVNDIDATLSYLQGMVIESTYQGKGYSTELLKNIYKHYNSDLFSLRTQNIKMALSMLNLFKDTLLKMPSKTISKESLNKLIESLRVLEPFYDIDDKGIIKNCYHNQLYPNLNDLKQIDSSINLESNDSLAVIVQPKTSKSKILLPYKQKNNQETEGKTK